MSVELKTIDTHRVPVRYFEGGSGEPLVYLHGAGGLRDGDPFLAELASRFHVYAPLVPGYGDSELCDELRTMLDFTLHAWDVVDALGLRDPILVGTSMGGMIAAEMAAVAPHDVTRLGLLCPVGLWLDDHPVADLYAAMPHEMPALLFHDVDAGAAMLTAGVSVDDPDFLQDYLVTNARQLGTAARILFPIPERGLAERLYRITARTVIAWGAEDRLVPAAHGREFQAGIAGAQLVTFPEAGHMVHWEKPRDCLDAIARVA